MITARLSKNVRLGPLLSKITQCMHRHFSALTMFALAGNPSKPIGGPTGRPGILQEQLRHLWRCFFRDNLCPDLTFGYQVKEVSGKIKLTIVLVVKRRIFITEELSQSSCVFR